MGCIHVAIKIILFIINFVVAILGLLLIAGGSVLAYYRHALTNGTSAGDEILTVAIVTIVIGGVVFLIAFCGCCGSIADIPCLLITYGVFISLLCIANIYAIVMLLVNQSATAALMTDSFNELFEDPDAREFFYVVEYYYSCCGTTGGGSYQAIQVAIPPTCCPNYEFPEINDIADIEEIINNLNDTSTDFCPAWETYGGCTTLFVTLTMDIFTIVGFVLIGILIGEAVAAMSAFYLVYHLRKQKGTVLQTRQTVFVYPEDIRCNYPEVNRGTYPEDSRRNYPEDNRRFNPEDNRRYNPEDNRRNYPEDNRRYNPEDNRRYNPENNRRYNPEDNRRY